MRRLPSVGALILCASALVSAQGGQPPIGAASAPQGRPPRPPENLKVLPPDTDLRVEMPKVAQALGVECGFCHVQGNFPSDEYPTKRTARRMMEMVKTMNASFFPKHEPTEGDSPLGGPVSCFTCHRGEKKPATAPAVSKPSPPLR